MNKLLILILCITFALPAAAQSKRRLAQWAAEKAACDSIYNSLTPFFTIGTDGELVFTRVISDPNQRDKAQLYARCLEILNTAFNDASEVIQSTDKAAGLILGKFKYYRPLADNIIGNYGSIASDNPLKIEIKDARIRATVSFVSLNKYVRNHGTTTYHVNNYYPFWKDCPAKTIHDSFYTILPVMEHCMAFLDHLQQQLATPASTENW